MSTSHGGADALTQRAQITLMDRPVVPLTQEVFEAAQQEGRSLQIVTPTTSRITTPLCALMAEGKAEWIVREPEGYYDGLTGRPFMWDGQSFTPVPNARDYARGYTQRPTEPLGTQLSLLLRVHHEPNTLLGGPTEHLMHAFTGAPPLGWGHSEPLQNLWNRQTLTNYLRAPGAATNTIITTGPRNAVAVSDFTFTKTAITEVTSLTIGFPAGLTPPLERLPHLISTVCAKHPILSMLARKAKGRSDMTQEPRWSGTPTPLGLAVRGKITGPPDLTPHQAGPMTWFPLNENWKTYQSLLEHLRP